MDSCDRNAAEGVFGTTKTAYGLDHVIAHLQETAVRVIQETAVRVIAVALPRFNLSRSLRASLALFSLLILLIVSLWLWSRVYVRMNKTCRLTNRKVLSFRCIDIYIDQTCLS